MTEARKGKIARCPLAIRDEVCRRLLDGESGPKILRWLNEQPEVLRVLDEYFAEDPVTAQNLSEWRQGGYQDWLARREQIEATKSLADYAARLGQAAGGSLTDGSAAIIGGKILEALEAGAAFESEAESKGEGESNAPDLGELARILVSLRSTDLDARKTAQRDRFLDQRERQIAVQEKEFQVRTCELFLVWYSDARAREIAESKSTKAVKLEQLRLEMFPKPAD